MIAAVHCPAPNRDVKSPWLSVLSSLGRKEYPLARAASQVGIGVSLVDAGIWNGDLHLSDPRVLASRIGNGCGVDALAGAMEPAEASICLDTVIAIGLAFLEAGLDLLCLSEVSCAGLDRISSLREAMESREPITALSSSGTYEIGIMAGLILSAAASRVPTVLGGRDSSAAALLAF